MVESQRAKFRCDKVTRKRGPREEVVFHAVTEDGGEDSDFAKATPEGEVKITIDNERALGWFEPGEMYYLHFVPAK